VVATGVGALLFDQVFFYAEPGYVYHVRTITGEEKVVSDVGYNAHLFGRYNAWKRAMTVQAVAGARISELQAEEESTTTSAQVPPLNIMFLDQVDACRFSVADTMDLWINIALDDLKALLRQIDGLVLNDSEAKLLTGESNMVVASQAIIDMGPKFVVIKKGEHGCMLNHGDGMAVLHAFPAKTVVDPTGAGDSFAGGMMGYLASIGEAGLTLQGIKRALAYGTIVASYNIESFSLERLLQLHRDDIDNRLGEYQQMLNVEA